MLGPQTARVHQRGGGADHRLETEQLGFANAMFGVGAVVGPTAGPVLGGYITGPYSGPWIFHVNVPVGILAAVVSTIDIRDPPEEHARHRALDWPGLFFLILGTGRYGVLFLYPQFVQLLLGYSAFQSGLSSMPGGLSAFLIMPVIGSALRKGVSVRLAAAAGFAIFFISAYLLSQTTLASGARCSSCRRRRSRSPA